VFMHCLGSFLLQDMFLNLQAFAFEGQNKKFTVNMLVTCILYCDAGPSCLIRTSCLQVQYVDSYHGYHVCHGTFFFGDAVALLRESESIFLSRVEGRG